MSELPKKRGRPRAFDPAVAVGRATGTFLRLGYSHASLEDLTTAMALSKPSLYAAFGDKRGLYLQSLRAFADVRGRRYAEAFARGETVEAALRGLFEEAVALNLGGDGPPGCLIACTATTEAVDDPAIAEFTREFFARCDRALAKGIRARLGGAAAGAGTAAAIARLATGVVNDISLRARVGETRARLLEHARQSATALAAAAGG